MAYHGRSKCVLSDLMVLGGVVWLRPSPIVHEHQISRLLAWSSRAVSFCISLRALWPGCLKTAPGPGTCDRLQGSCEVPVECVSLGGAVAMLRSRRLPAGRVLFIVSLPRFLPTRPRSHLSLSLSLCVPPSPLNLASSLEARTYFYCQRSVQLWTPAWSAACFRCRASGHQSSQYSVGVRRQFLGMVLGRTSVLGPRPST